MCDIFFGDLSLPCSGRIKEVALQRILVGLLFVLCKVIAHEAETYAFEGKHFMASYYDCDAEALVNLEALEQAMAEAVKASGATILGSATHHFLPDGLTLVFLLSESHASIHTYPEHRCCFVDLFTCGDQCHAEPFDAQLRSYLRPGDAQTQQLMRE